MPALTVDGLGFGLFVPTLIDLVLAGVPAARAGAASGALTSFQQVGAALGVTLIGIVYFGVLAGRDADPGASAEALSRGLLYEVAVFAIVLALVTALPRLRPAPVVTAPNAAG